MRAQHAAAFQHQTQSFTGRRRGRRHFTNVAGIRARRSTLRFQNVAANKFTVRWIESDRPGQATFERRDRFVHVQAIQIHARLKPQRVARTQATRPDAGVQQFFPERKEFRVRQNKFVAVFTGVAGGRDKPRHRMERLERLQCERCFAQVFGEERLDPFANLRTLHRQDAELAAMVHFHAERRRLFPNPGEILLRGSGIDDQPKPILALKINNEVVNHAALLVEHAGVQRFAWHLEFGDIVGDQMPQKFARACAVQIHRRHVRHVEHAAARAHRVMLLELRAVMNRHVPAGEIHQLGAEALVFGMQYGFLEHHGVRF